VHVKSIDQRVSQFRDDSYRLMIAIAYEFLRADNCVLGDLSLSPLSSLSQNIVARLVHNEHSRYILNVRRTWPWVHGESGL